MNFAQSGAVAARPSQELSTDPIGPVIVKSLDFNIGRMHESVCRIEDQLHNILNLRQPQKEEKAETPMENDLNSAISNRLKSISYLNERLETIVSHLNKIVG